MDCGIMFLTQWWLMHKPYPVLKRCLGVLICSVKNEQTLMVKGMSPNLFPVTLTLSMISILSLEGPSILLTVFVAGRSIQKVICSLFSLLSVHSVKLKSDFSSIRPPFPPQGSI